MINRVVEFATGCLAIALQGPGLASAAPALGTGAPKPAEWAALAKLPDWGGVWVPDVRDQMRQHTANAPPWTAPVAAQMAKLDADEKAGRPFLLLNGCFPHGMPSFMLITHNAIEILFTPGRTTILGESDGNRLRRIYTDGRAHPESPDLTFHGHSTGHWEGQTLVVDTVGVSPQAYIATTEGVGVPNDGDMHIVERIHLQGSDVLADDLTITAPKVLTAPWTTTRLFKRIRGPDTDIVEGQCVQGQFTTGKDKNGHNVFIPIPQNEDGSIRAPKP
jgi:hypothetical protein